MPECNNCGDTYEKGDLFCGKCGEKIVEKKPRISKKKPVEEPPKKEKAELSEYARRKLKGELEISINAFKRGEITVEEFQKIKNSIVTKAKAGFYDKPEPQEHPISEPHSYSLPEPPLALDTDFTVSRESFNRPPIEKTEPVFSKLWFIVPVLFNIFGGLIAYFAIKDRDEKSSKKMLAIGVVSFIVFGGAAGYYLKTEGVLSSDNKVGVSNEIVVEGLETIIDDEIPDLEDTIPINATNNSAESMNLNLEDLGPGFEINEILTGSLNDPLEFAGGNLSLTNELMERGWLENHRIVFKKEVIDSESNGSITEKEITSSITKYNVSNITTLILERDLTLFKEELNNSGYVLIDFEINESGVMGKKVSSDENGIKTVTYNVFFYKQDTVVTLLVEGVTRKLTEDDVKGYAQLIESRIK